MDRPIIFHRVEPEVRKSSYNSFDNVDFVLTGFDGRNLDLNSVRLEGVLNCTYNGVNVIAGNESITTNALEGMKVVDIIERIYASRKQ